MRVCRLCLMESDDEEVIVSLWDSKENFADRIKKCVSIEVTLPTALQ